jgi:hypothetical protein
VWESNPQLTNIGSSYVLPTRLYFCYLPKWRMFPHCHRIHLVTSRCCFLFSYPFISKPTCLSLNTSFSRVQVMYANVKRMFELTTKLYLHSLTIFTLLNLFIGNTTSPGLKSLSTCTLNNVVVSPLMLRTMTYLVLFSMQLTIIPIVKIANITFFILIYIKRLNSWSSPTLPSIFIQVSA